MNNIRDNLGIYPVNIGQCSAAKEMVFSSGGGRDQKQRYKRMPYDLRHQINEINAGTTNTVKVNST